MLMGLCLTTSAIHGNLRITLRTGIYAKKFGVKERRQELH